MSVAYQRWEAASCPTMGYKMAFQGKNNMCLVPDTLSPDASSYSESFLKVVMGGSDTSDGLLLPNSNGLMPQDNVTRGFSSLSIRSPQGNMNAKWFPSDEITTPNTVSQLSEYSMQARGSGFSSIGHEGKCRPLCPLPSKLSKPGCMATSLPDGRHSKVKLAVVVEEKALEDDPSSKICNEIGDNDLETDSSSSLATDSISSLDDMPIDSQVSSGDGSSSTGEAEVQSEYQGLSGSCTGSSPPKKGLSRFYAGKSRSFSCLADVVSLKDLAKPENPYSKKRKSNAGRGSHGRPQLPPLQKGVASISKKLPSTGKSTLALAVAMSAKDDEIDIPCDTDFQKCSSRVGRWQESVLASRSYSFSDLQGIMGRYAPPS